MTATPISGRPLHPGGARGPLIRLDEPISFWGGFDPADGRIIDRSHPQHGAVLTGAIVAMPGSRGSSGTPGVLGEAIRRQTGPAGLLVTKADINLVAGAVVAEALYGQSCPIVQIDARHFAALAEGGLTAVGADGSITQHPSAS